MTAQNFDVNNLRVAKPCHIGWETMSGDEKVRICNACEMNIYNISEMTSAEVTTLIQTREGRLCGRIVRRTDGTVMTKDCPVGIRAYRKRISRFAGAVFATVISLFTAGYGQTDEKNIEKSKDIKITRLADQNNEIAIRGIVTDSNGSVIPEAKIILRKKNGKFYKKTKSSDNGNFEIKRIPSGEYKLEIKAKHFKPYNNNFTIEEKKTINLDIVLEVEDVSVTVGIFASEPLIDMSETGITHTISRETLRKLPINK